MTKQSHHKIYNIMTTGHIPSAEEDHCDMTESSRINLVVRLFSKLLFPRPRIHFQTPRLSYRGQQKTLNLNISSSLTKLANWRRWLKAPDLIPNEPSGECLWYSVMHMWGWSAAHFVQTSFWSHSIFNTTIIIIRISKVSSIHTSFALWYTNLSWFMFLYLSFVVLRINLYCLDIVLIHWIVLKNLKKLFQEREHLIGHVLLSNIKSFWYFQM